MPLVDLVEAFKKAVPNWDPAKHPRDRDGQFIETGDLVAAYENKEAAEPEVVGRVHAAYYAPDGRLFVGVEAYGYVRWYRPKQIEHIKAKAHLKSGKEKPPELPLPTVDAQYDEVFYTNDEPFKKLGTEVDEAVQNPGAADLTVKKSDLDPEFLEMIGLANGGPSPSTVPQPGEVKIPAGKTPDDMLRMIQTSFDNKYDKDSSVIYPGGKAGFALDLQEMLEDTDFKSAAEKLSKLMTAAKLGGKQRKRYNSILAQKHGGHQVAEYTPVEPAPEPVPPLQEWEEALLAPQSDYDFAVNKYSEAMVEGDEQLVHKIANGQISDTSPAQVQAAKDVLAEAMAVTEADDAELMVNQGIQYGTDTGYENTTPELVQQWKGAVNGGLKQLAIQTAKDGGVTEAATAAAQYALVEVWAESQGTAVTDADLDKADIDLELFSGAATATEMAADPDAELLSPAGGGIAFDYEPGAYTVFQKWAEAGDFEQVVYGAKNSPTPTVANAAKQVLAEAYWGLHGEKAQDLADKNDVVSDTGITTDELNTVGGPMHGVPVTEAPAPAPAPDPGIGQVWFDIADGLPSNAMIFSHPQGSLIVADPVAGTVTKYNPSGKKASTSATYSKLLSGHGQWSHVGVGPQGLIDHLENSAPGAAPTPSAATALSPAAKAEYDEYFPIYLDSIKQMGKPSQFIQDVASGAQGATPGKIAAAQEAIKQGTAQLAAQDADEPTPLDHSQDEVLLLLKTSMQNKGTSGLSYFELESQFDQLLLEQDYEPAYEQLAKLMTAAKLGGKQRKRYKDALAAKYGIGPNVIDKGSKADKIGGAGGWAAVTPSSGTNQTPIGVTGPTKGNALVNPSVNSPQAAKATIQEQLAERLKGKVTMEQLTAAILHSKFVYGLKFREMAEQAATYSKSGGVGPGKVLIKNTFGMWEVGYPHMGGKEKIANPTPQDWERAMLETVANSLIQQWAGTSNDSNARALAMQEAAVEEFSLSNAYEWPADSTLKADTNWELNKHRKLYRAFLREMYNNTQEWAKTNGVKRVRLRRGSGQYAGPVGSVANAKLRPMSSFSTNYGTAAGFGSNRIEAYVPIEWVIGNAATGYGCQSEYEWVILGGTHQVRVIA